MNDYQFTFTVFTPTYNRENLIHRVFESLQKQTFIDFEWIVIDDGSIDNTCEIIKKYSSESTFPIRYIKKNNQGKVAAINDALNLASGFFFLVFDSDDWCTEDALSELFTVWSGLSDGEKKEYAAISCLKQYSDGRIVGEDYQRMPRKNFSYIDRFNLRIKGDKWECIRTDVHKKFNYALKRGDRYMAPEYAWLLIGHEYKTVFVNKPLSIVEYQLDGISQNNINYRVANVNSTIAFYELAELCAEGFINRVKVKINMGRFYLHRGSFIKSLFNSNFLFLFSLVYFLYDIKKIKKK